MTAKMEGGERKEKGREGEKEKRETERGREK